MTKRKMKFLRKIGMFKIKQKSGFNAECEIYCHRWYHPIFILYTIIIFPIGVFMIGVPETINQIKQAIIDWEYWQE